MPLALPPPPPITAIIFNGIKPIFYQCALLLCDLGAIFVRTGINILNPKCDIGNIYNIGKKNVIIM